MKRKFSEVLVKTNDLWKYLSKYFYIELKIVFQKFISEIPLNSEFPKNLPSEDFLLYSIVAPCTTMSM